MTPVAALSAGKRIVEKPETVTRCGFLVDPIKNSFDTSARAATMNWSVVFQYLGVQKGLPRLQLNDLNDFRNQRAVHTVSGP